MTDIGLNQFLRVGTHQKVGFDGPGRTGLETREAQRSFFGQVVGWVQNRSDDHRAEKRDMMGAFFNALSREYGFEVAAEAFGHGIGEPSGRSLRGTQIHAAQAYADAAAVDRFMVNLNTINRSGVMDSGFVGLMTSLGVDATHLDQAERSALADAIATRIAANTTGGARLSWQDTLAQARMALQPLPRFRAAEELHTMFTAQARGGAEEARIPGLKRAYQDFVDAPGFKALPAGVQDAFCTKLADKIRYLDLDPVMSLKLENPAELRHSMTLVLAECLSPPQLQAMLKGMGDRDILELVAHGFAPDTPYGDHREGAAAIASALKAMLAADTVNARAFDHLVPSDGRALRRAIDGLESGFLDAKEFRGFVIEGNLGCRLALAAAEAEAGEHVNTFRDALSSKAGQLATKLDARITAIDAGPDDGKGELARMRSARDALMELHDNPPEKADVEGFARVFGFRFETTSPFIDLDVRADDPDRGLVRAAQGFAQVTTQIAAAKNPDTSRELSALGKMVQALPTAGKPLESFTYLPSLVTQLGDTLGRLGARDGSTHAMADYPILVFDQSSKTAGPGQTAMFDRNAAYVGTLAGQTGANIQHVSMDQVMTLAGKLGIEGMFDTTGAGKAGYGGARNISFLVGPMLHKALRDPDAGVRSMDDLAGKPNDYLEGLMRDVLNGTGGEMVLMGDDDTTLRPGFLDAKMQLAAEADGGYAKIVTLTLGRATTNIPDVTNEDIFQGIGFHEDAMITGLERLDIALSSGMRATQWEGDSRKAVEHQMAGALMHPGSCLDLPLPSEEGHFANYQDYVVDWLGGAIHHPGDRFASIGKRAEQLSGYSGQANQAIHLLGVNDKPFSASLPWNDKTRSFDNLGAIYAFAADPATLAGMKKAFLTRLVNLEPNRSFLGADAAFQTLENREAATLAKDPLAQDRVSQARAALVAASTGYATSLAYRDNLVSELMSAYDSLPDDEEKSMIDARLRDGTDKAARSDALAYLVDHGGADLAATLSEALDAARTATPGYATSELAGSMNLIATSALLRFGALADRFAELTREAA